VRVQAASEGAHPVLLVVTANSFARDTVASEPACDGGMLVPRLREIAEPMRESPR